MAGKKGLKDFLKSPVTKKKLRELIFIRLIPQFLIRTKKQKIIKDKEGIQKNTDNKKKGQGGNFGKSGKMVTITIYPLTQSWECDFTCFWFHSQSSPLLPDTIPPQMITATLPYLSSHPPLKHKWFQIISSRVLSLPPQFQSNPYTTFRRKPPLSILWSPVYSKLSATERKKSNVLTLVFRALWD